MRINFYDARISEDARTILVKEKGVNYESTKMNGPEEISLMLKPSCIWTNWQKNMSI